MPVSRLILFAFSLFGTPVAPITFAHGGDVDASGGHRDRINGGYHYHQGRPSSSSHRRKVWPSNAGRVVTIETWKSNAKKEAYWEDYDFDFLGLDSEEGVIEKLEMSSWTGKVIGITDGDTIEVMYAGKAAKIRLEGIDAPEIGQPWGEQAKQVTEQLALNKDVKVVAKERGRYGRIIANVYLPSGHELGQVLVATGYAWWYREYSDDSTLEKLEEAAKSSGQGLWSKADPIPPWQWRKK